MLMISWGRDDAELMSGLEGKDLEGFRIAVWYAVYGTDAEGNSSGPALGFFLNPSLAKAWGRAKGKSVGEPPVRMCFVLTKDGKSGITLGSGMQQAALNDNEEALSTAVTAALAKLTPEDRKVLGIKES